MVYTFKQIFLSFFIFILLSAPSFVLGSDARKLGEATAIKMKESLVSPEVKSFAIEIRKGNVDKSSLFRANLRFANLSNVDLSGANLSKSILHGVTFISANLSSASLGGANLVGANLSQANLDGAFLSGAILVEATLRNTSLRNAYLKNAEFQSAYLLEADFSGANLQGVNFGGAESRLVNFNSANLENARFDRTNLQNSLFIKSNLKNANFFRANLTGVDFSSADMSSVVLNSANLSNVNLSSAILEDVQLDSTNLGGAYIVSNGERYVFSGVNARNVLVFATANGEMHLIRVGKFFNIKNGLATARTIFNIPDAFSKEHNTSTESPTVGNQISQFIKGHAQEINNEKPEIIPYLRKTDSSITRADIVRYSATEFNLDLGGGDENGAWMCQYTNKCTQNGNNFICKGEMIEHPSTGEMVQDEVSGTITSSALEIQDSYDAQHCGMRGSLMGEYKRFTQGKLKIHAVRRDRVKPIGFQDADWMLYHAKSVSNENITLLRMNNVDILDNFKNIWVEIVYLTISENQDSASENIKFNLLYKVNGKNPYEIK